MARALLGPTISGRYPRWHYLDRLEANETMPRACVTTLGLVAFLGVCVLLAQPFWPVHTLLPEPMPEASRIGIHPLPVPVPPPSLRASGPLPPLRLQAPRFGAILPVEDDIAPTQTVSNLAAGDPEGTQDGDPGAAPVPDGTHGSLVIDRPENLRPDAFVAVEREPELLAMQEPTYPELARDARIEGTVLVRALVGADGAVLRTQLLQGVTGLDAAALGAVATAVFRPALQQGQPVAAWVVVPIQFRLRP